MDCKKINSKVVSGFGGKIFDVLPNVDLFYDKLELSFNITLVKFGARPSTLIDNINDQDILLNFRIAEIII